MAERGNRTVWRWWVCGLLLCASMINYMDRQTLANVAVRIGNEFGLNQEQYGDLEFGFGIAFAVGALVFGWLADRVSLRWLYPVVLFLWSAMGFLTAYSGTYEELLVCRTALGFFEAGHWPCSIKTTQHLLAPEDRTMGNSVLQSGASLGAIVTPLLMTAMLAGRPDVGAWRLPFQVVGLVGVFWIVAWLLTVRRGDLPEKMVEEGGGGGVSVWVALGRLLIDRRFLCLCVVIACINTSWQLVRAWLPKFLQQGRGYSEAEALGFNAAYFLATDVGCLAAGALSLALVGRGVTVHRSRLFVFLLFGALTGLTVLVPSLPRGWLLLGVLLLVGAGALGVFPCYHAWTQDLSRQHMGMVTGMLSTVAWLVSGVSQKVFGRMVDRLGSFDGGLAVAGLMPMLAFLVVWLFWPGRGEEAWVDGGGKRG